MKANINLGALKAQNRLEFAIMARENKGKSLIKVFVIFKIVPSACPSPSYLFDIKICLKYVCIYLLVS